MREGLFVVLEGIDGAGTTTQVARLVASLRARGIGALGTREPSDGPIGTQIRQILTGRLVVRSPAGGAAPPGWPTLALLFAADRVDHLESEIVPNLRDGVIVVSDRYDHSSVAYQGAATDDPAIVAWIRAINGRARRPDLTIVLDVPADVALERRRRRAGRAELYEVDELQCRLAAYYARIDAHFPEDTVLHLDGARDADAVAADILAAVEARLAHA